MQSERLGDTAKFIDEDTRVLVIIDGKKGEIESYSIGLNSGVLTIICTKGK